jgi:cytochrome c
MLHRNLVTAAVPVLTALLWLNTQSTAQPRVDGKALFEKRCGGCHSLDRDKEGPRLGGVYGRVAGSVDSFQYSEALKKSKVKWMEDTLNQWLTDTEKLVPNNDMAFHVESAEERSAIIGYLKQNSK